MDLKKHNVYHQRFKSKTHQVLATAYGHHVLDGGWGNYTTRYAGLLKPSVLFLALLTGFVAPIYAKDTQIVSDLSCAQPNKKGLFPLIKPARSSGLPIPEGDATRLTSDYVEGTTTAKARASGDVIVERNTQTLNAPEMIFDQQKSVADVKEDFTLSDEFSRIKGRGLHYNLEDDTGTALKAFFERENPEGRLQGQAEKINMLAKNFYQMEDVKVNNCGTNDASWYIQASDVKTDWNKNIGVAKHARFVFHGVPIFYTPWVDFPLTGSRKSGFLTPRLGFGSNGLELGLPYYLNLAPNLDATITPNYISKRGATLGGELRYLQPKYAGILSGEWMPHDTLSNLNNRGVLNFTHNQVLTPKISMGIDYHSASDDDYFRDLGNRLYIAENVNLNRQAWLNYRDTYLGGAFGAKLEVQHYQTLQDTNKTLTEPYRLMPKLSAHWYKRQGKARISLDTQITRFTHETLQEGSRYVLNPSVKLNLNNAWGFVHPKIGLHATHYQLYSTNNQQARNVSRVLPIVSVDSGLVMEREFSLGSRGYMQTLEPRLFYTYIPTRDQHDLPNFDSSENTFSYDQLFRENRFSGEDRINAANQLSLAVQSRFYEDKTGVERFRMGIGQRFYLKKDDVDLSGKVGQHTKSSSDIVGFMSGKISDSVFLKSDLHYDQNLNRVASVSSSVRYQPKNGKILSLGVGFDRNSSWYGGHQGELKYIDIAAQWPFFKQYHVIARNNYSITHKKSLDQLLGISYQSDCGCWGANVVFQRYVTDIDKTKTAVFLQLQFKGLGGLGTNATEELRRSVPGYSSIYEVK